MQTSAPHDRLKELHDGAAFYCRHCQSRSILRKKNEYDGFTIRRSYYCCAFCNTEIDPAELLQPPSDSSSDMLSGSVSSKAHDDSLAALFGASSSANSGVSSLDALFGSSSDHEDESLDSLLPSPAGSSGPAEGAESCSYHFCKNCIHHFQNPFRVHCVLHDRDVEPLSDCPDFSPLQTQSSLPRSGKNDTNIL